MSQLTGSMLAEVKSAFAGRDLTNLSQRFDQLVVLRDAVLTYLQKVGRRELSDSESEEHDRLVAATGEIETLGAAISRDLAPLSQALVDAEVTPSKDTADLFDRLLQATIDAARAALHAVVERDQQAAQTVVAGRGGEKSSRSRPSQRALREGRSRRSIDPIALDPAGITIRSYA